MNDSAEFDAAQGTVEYRRARRSRGYESISRDMLQRPDLSWQARGMLAFLLSLPSGFDPHGAEGMARFGPLGAKGVETVLREMSDNGLLARVKRRRPGTRSGWDWLWTWSDDPADVTADVAAWMAADRRFDDVSAGGTVTPPGGEPSGGTPSDGGLFDVSAGGAVTPPGVVPPGGEHKGLQTTDLQTTKINPYSPPPANVAFEAFWRTYPRRTAKEAARTAWTKATVDRKADPRAIVDAAQVFAAAWDRPDAQREFIPHPSTWLNQGRYDDDAPDVSVERSALPTVGKLDQKIIGWQSMKQGTGLTGPPARQGRLSGSDQRELDA